MVCQNSGTLAAQANQIVQAIDDAVEFFRRAERRRDEGIGARGQHQSVIAHDIIPTLGANGHGFSLPVDGKRLGSRVNGQAKALEIIEWLQDDPGFHILPGKPMRKHRPRIIPMGFLGDHGNQNFGREGVEFLGQGDAGHTGTNDDELSGKACVLRSHGGGFSDGYGGQGKLAR